jgi:CubicO group peptidase (beta-lactamase class C family)
MRRFQIVLSAFLVAASLSAQQDFDKLAADAMSAWRFPGMAIAVVQNDRVVYLKGFGAKEIGKTDRVSPDSLFQIGSTSKAFTTTAMAMLVDEKKLDWDDPVRKHLQYFHLADPCADSMVTLRDAVSHRTGLSRHDELWDNSPWSREEVIRRAGEVKLARQIRTTYQYNNIMFIAAGEAVAAAGKTSWDDFVRARIFQPLGMTNTRTLFADWAPSDHATGHDWSHDQAVIHPAADDTNVGPAGSIKSSARDMAQWLRFQLANGVIDGKRLVSEDALNETKTAQMALRVDKASRETNPFIHVQSYAMGWNVQDYRGELLISHGGALNGFRTQVALLPDRNAAVVILVNVGRGFGVIALRNAILDELLHAAPSRDWTAAYLAAEKKANDRAEQTKKDREAKRVANTKPSRDLAAYAGIYHDEAYGDAIVALENGALVLRWSRMAIPLSHYNYDTFLAVSEPDDVDETVQFALGPDGEEKTMSVYGEEFVKKAMNAER